MVVAKKFLGLTVASACLFVARAEQFFQGSGGGGFASSSAFDPAGGDPADGIDPAVLMEIMEAISHCDIDVTGLIGKISSLSDGGGNNPTAGGFSGQAGAGGMGSNEDDIDYEELANLLESFVNPVDQICSDKKEATFRAAFKDFETCSGFDMETLLETWPAAVLGEIIECASTYADVFLSALKSGTVANIGGKMSDKCIEAVYGPNSFGNFNRLMWMQPDMICGCLGSFSQAVPHCTLEEWPIPLVGDWMRTSTCVLHAACPLYDAICEFDFITLNKCLPPVGEQNYDCKAVEKACAGNPNDFTGQSPGSLLLNFPQEMTGAPMPDACQRVAKMDNYRDMKLVQRYQEHIDKCVNVWEGWTEDYVPPPLPPKSEGTTPVVNTEFKATTRETASPPVVVTKKQWGGFFGGMLTATVLFAVGAALWFVWNKRNGVKYEGMHAHGLELTAHQALEVS